MHKLSRVEAQRVLGVLGETCDRLGRLSVVPARGSADVFRALESSKCLGVVSALESQLQLEEALCVERERYPNKESGSGLEKRVRANTRALCRALLEDAEAVSVLSQSHAFGEEKQGEAEPEEQGSSAPSWSLEGLQRVLVELESIVLTMLTTTVEDEHGQKVLCQTILAREREAEENRQALEHQLAIARRNRRRMVSELDALVSKLRGELRASQACFADEEAALAREIKGSTERLVGTHRVTLERLAAEESKLEERRAHFANEVEAEELLLAKKKSKYEAEVNALVTKYDADMSAKQGEIDALQTQYEADKRRLRQLEEHFSALDDESARVAAEESQWRAYLQTRSAEDNKLDNAALKLQQLWRGYMVRKELKQAKEGGKKGGKKSAKK
jgi:hypothetical protein